MQGEEYTQQSYCEKANAFKQEWLQSHPEVNSALQSALQVLPDPHCNQPDIHDLWHHVH